jgi:CRP-like cAMP-binding protein
MTQAATRVIDIVAAHAPFNPQARVCGSCGIRRLALFGVLDDAGLDQIHVQIADIHLDAGASLYAAGSNGRAAFTVRSGVVRLERSNALGERRIVRLIGPGDLVGIEAMLGQTYAADAVACTEVSVCRLPRVLIDDLSRDRPELLRDLMKRWQRALDDAEEWLTELSAGSARHRMLRLLLKLSEFTQDNRVWLPSRQEMGAMLNLTFETASRVVSALRREGVIGKAEGLVISVDLPRVLAELSLEASAER